MHNINPRKVGFTLGAFAGLVHVVWSLLVFLGFAQPFVDFIFRMHFIKPLYLIGEFNLMTAIELVAITSIIGSIVGYVFAVIWNKLHQQ